VEDDPEALNRLAQVLAHRRGPGDQIDAARELAGAEHKGAELRVILPGRRTEAAPVSGARPAPGKPGPGGEGTDLHIGAEEKVQLRLLGPVDLTVGGTVRHIPGQRPKAVLAILALNPGRVVAADRLIDAVWGDRAPVTATNSLQHHISRLRRLFGARTTILARAPGYVLNLDAEATDVAVAERLIRLGMTSAEPIQRVDLLQGAVDLWRGPALMDVTGSPGLEEQAERLNRLRLQAQEALVEARLGLGQHTLVLQDLESLVREHPLHETVYRQLMLALYRGGRQGEALAVYHRLRSALRAELGIDPSRPLRDLEGAILRQDACLDT